AAVGVDAEIQTSRDGANVDELVREGLAGGYRNILAVGGDGTVNLVVNALMAGQAAGVTLGILPAGSGCDLLRTFGISQQLERAAHHLVGTDTYTIDVGFVEGPWGRRYFANVASLGLGAAVVRQSARFPSWFGGARYKIGVWPAVAIFRKTPLRIVADSRDFEGTASLVVLANAQFFGGGMNIAPKASTVDGKLDVQVFTGPKRNAMVLQHRVNRGTHLTHEAVRRFSASDVEISIDRAWDVEADGEYLGMAESLVAGVIPGAVDIKI
ncbi:MAG: YegS/Rv2252/BmrU family lipid kinase, partial [Acidimicrobiia bacterium]|nr:YegS/Rv2252/BmrU family lipid kinase [Acidimicrobiia bacterium]